MSLKWPVRLTLIRHARSAYNELVLKKQADPDYRWFRDLFDQDPDSVQTRSYAEMLAERYALPTGDHMTPLAEGAFADAALTGRNLKIVRHGEVPNIIYVSPYLRARETLRGMIEGWPELARCKVEPEEDIREQEHGLQTLYNDKRIMFALHPHERKLHAKDGDFWYRYPNGENVPDVLRRWRNFLGKLIRENSREDVLCIGHDRLITASGTSLERLTEDEYLELDRNYTPVNCGVTTYVGVCEVGRNSEGKLMLHSYNQKLY